MLYSVLFLSLSFIFIFFKNTSSFCFHFLFFIFAFFQIIFSACLSIAISHFFPSLSLLNVLQGYSQRMRLERRSKNSFYLIIHRLYSVCTVVLWLLFWFGIDWIKFTASGHHVQLQDTMYSCRTPCTWLQDTMHSLLWIKFTALQYTMYSCRTPCSAAGHHVQSSLKSHTLSLSLSLSL